MRDVYHEAVCKERWFDQHQHPQHVKLDEASWAHLETRPLDGALYRLCSLALLRLSRCLLALASRVQAATATSGAAVTWRPTGRSHKGS